MTEVTSTSRAAGGATYLRVLRAEWTKFRSLRSSLWSLLAAAGVVVGLAVAFAAADVSRWDRMSPQDRGHFDATQVCLFGVFLAQLSVGVLGVLTISSEYATGTILSTVAAVPHRLPVLWAKAGVLAVTTLLTMIPVTVLAFFLGQAVLSGKNLDVSFSHPDTPRAVIGAACYLAVIALLGLSLGAILRSTVGAVSVLTGVLLGLPILANLLPGTWGQEVTKYLPSTAGQAIMTVNPSSASLNPLAGFAVLCGYTAAALLVGAVLVQRRDV